MLFKKVAVAAAILIPAVTLLSYCTKVGSYSSTAWNNFTVCASKQVPVEFEVSRLKNEISRLIPDLRKNLSAVAEEIVAVENMTKELNRTRQNLATMQANCREMHQKLKTGDSQIVYKGQTFDAKVLARDLDRQIKDCKRTETEIKTREELLAARERSLDAAKEQLASMREQKEQLEVQVAQLEADLKTIRLAQTRSKFTFDDSRLGEIKQSVSDLRDRLRVEKLTLDMENDDLAGNAKTPKADSKAINDVVNEAGDYLDGAKVADKK